MKRLIACCVAVCGAVLALGAPVASATAAYSDVRTCTADAKWQLSLNYLGNGTADVAFTNIVCDARITTVDIERLGLVAVGARSTGSFTRQLAIAGLANLAGSTFSGSFTDPGYPQTQGVLAVTGDKLTAWSVNTNAGNAQTGAWTPIGSCGANCFLTAYTAAVTTTAVS